jgi:hypothetical protein
MQMSAQEQMVNKEGSKAGVFSRHSHTDGVTVDLEAELCSLRGFEVVWGRACLCQRAVFCGQCHLWELSINERGSVFSIAGHLCSVLDVDCGFVIPKEQRKNCPLISTISY